MKKMIATSMESVVFEGFEVLTNNDMLKVRGGEERPKTKDRDVYDEDLG